MAKQTDGRARELMDTAFFDQKHTSHTLLGTEEWTSTLCQFNISWVLGLKDQRQAYPFLHLAQPVKTDLGIVLWKIDMSNPKMANALHCGDR